MNYFILASSLLLVLACPAKSLTAAPTNQTNAQEQVQSYLVYVNEPQPGAQGQQEARRSQEPMKEIVHIEEVPVKIPVLIPIKVPYPVKIPLPVPIPVKYPYIVKRKVEVPIEKKVPYTVEKPYPVKIVKKVPYEVPEPYPVKVPVQKTRHVYYELEYPQHHTERRTNIPIAGYGHQESGVYKQY